MTDKIREGILTPLIKHYLTGKRLTVIDYNKIADEQLTFLDANGLVIWKEKKLPKLPEWTFINKGGEDG